MTNKIIKSSLFILIIFFLTVIYLSFYGIETNKLNKKIKEEITNINKNLDLELKTIRILLSPLDLKIDMKTHGPKIKLRNQEIELESIKTKISLISFFKNKFSINNLEISTKLIKIKDLISLSKSFNNSAELIIFDKFTESGDLMAEIDLNFNENGELKDDYSIKGFLKNFRFTFLEKFNLEILDLQFNIQKQKYQVENIKFNFNKIYFSSDLIKLEKINDELLVNGKINSNKQEILKKDIVNFDIDFVEGINLQEIIFSSENTFNFKINKKYKIKDFNIESEINLNKLKYIQKSSLRSYFPELKNEIYFKDHKIKLTKSKNLLGVKGKGKLLLQNNLDEITYNITNKNDVYNFEIYLDILKNKFLIDFLNYKKKDDSKATLNIRGIYEKDKLLQFKSISLKENENSFLINDLFLDNNFKLIKVDLIKLNFFNNNKIKNKIKFINNRDNYSLKGTSLDIDKIVHNIVNSDNKNELSKIINIKDTRIIIDIDKVYLDTENFVNEFKGEITLKKNKVNNMILNSVFTKNENLKLTIKDINGEKITTFYSARAKPFVKRYKFIKGFENGSLDFYSTKKNDFSNSQIKIYDFKLQKLPALTKILTLASLQGIADLLSGQGIRFNEFEMNFNNKDTSMTIEEIYALGPAISILMEGYIEKDQLVSLRGTLVPATTINKAIGSIPILGDILVGKKVGEGVFGVSFKIKGPPNKLETSVNPIKTLTPRFITRTLEKIKKN
jgi:hypothetical protein